MDYPLKDYYKFIYRKYDLVNRIFTFGQDRSWRKNAVRECLANNPQKVLDVCTGTGDLILLISAASEREMELIGYDFSPEMLQLAKDKANAAERRVEFIEGNVAAMPFKDKHFDSAGIAFGIRNLIYQNSNAERHLAEICRVLRPGGRFVILESSKPSNRIWRSFNGIYLQFILPYLGGAISGNLKAYKYLASSSKNYYTVSEMIVIIEKAGFKVLKHESFFFGSVMQVVSEKKT